MMSFQLGEIPNLIVVVSKDMLPVQIGFHKWHYFIFATLALPSFLALFFALFFFCFLFFFSLLLFFVYYYERAMPGFLPMEVSVFNYILVFCIQAFILGHIKISAVLNLLCFVFTCKCNYISIFFSVLNSKKLKKLVLRLYLRPWLCYEL